MDCCVYTIFGAGGAFFNLPGGGGSDILKVAEVVQPDWLGRRLAHQIASRPRIPIADVDPTECFKRPDLLSSYLVE